MNIRLFCLVAAWLCISFAVWARPADSTLNADPYAHTVISLITCGTGEELYSSFGHTAVRIKDSTQGMDRVYNYGTFNFGDPDFYTKFTLGKLPYYLDRDNFADFIQVYIYEKRTVDEQELKLTGDQKKKIIDYLENNLKPENRAYAYDFLFDNCATRVRDIFPGALGSGFKWGNVLGDKRISYRNMLDRYLAARHWTRFGINLLLGSKVDSLMTDEGAMFLPDFLYKGMEDATIDGQLITLPNRAIVEKTQQPKIIGFNTPFWTFTAVLFLLVISYFVPALAGLKKVMNFLLLFVTGLLGCFMLFMWLGTNHQSCSYNWNILWAFPLNIFVAFAAFRHRKWLRMYALIAISLLIVALLITVIGIQQLPLMEIIPILAALMFVFMDMYKKAAALK